MSDVPLREMGITELLAECERLQAIARHGELRKSAVWPGDDELARLAAQAKAQPVERELEHVARVMAEYRLDSVKMPSGLEVIKTVHASLDPLPPDARDVDAAAERKLEAMGILNSTEESGRIGVEQEEVLFAASRAPELDLSQFRPAVPGEEPSDGDDQ